MIAIILIFTFIIGFWLLWSVSKKPKDDPLDKWEASQVRRKRMWVGLEMRNPPKPPEKRNGTKS